MKHVKALQISFLAGLVAISSCTTSGLDYDQTDHIFENNPALKLESVKINIGTLGIEAQNYVFKSSEDFKDYLINLYEGQDSIPEVPEFDFSKNMILLAVMGLKTSGGYAIEIDKAVNANGVIAVRVLKIVKCFGHDAFNTPYHVVKIERSDLPVKFITEHQFEDCSNID